MTSQAIERPRQAAATSGDADGGEQRFEVPASYLFRRECHYNVYDIAEISGILLETVQNAAGRREISLVCTESSRGKSWPGDGVVGWFERSGHVCRVERRVFEQYLADERGRAANAEAAKRRAEAERENRERPIRFYREVAERSPVVHAVLEMLSMMEASGHTVADVLRVLDTTPAAKT
jgi:hypothetical protein